MFQFEDISFIYYLLGLPLVALLLYGVHLRRGALLSKLGDAEVVERLMPDYSKVKWWVRFGLLLGSLAFLVFAGSNPQWGTKKEKAKALSADIFIALDISQSMMAEDISPSRLERAKRWTEKLVENLKGDRLGLIYFAGDAYLQSPLTTDYAAIELFVRSANTDLAGTQGTAIDEAISLATKAYEDDVAHQRALIIISDGEDHDQEAVQLAREKADGGLLIYTVGVGTEAGSFVPYMNRGVEQFKKDSEGKPVQSKLNIPYLQDIANAGSGEFYLVNQGQEAIDDLKTRLARMQRREVEQNSFSEYNSYFQYFLLIGLLLCFLEWIIPETKKWYSLR